MFSNVILEIMRKDCSILVWNRNHSFMFGAFLGCKDVQNRNGAAMETLMQSWKYSVAHGQPPLLYKDN